MRRSPRSRAPDTSQHQHTHTSSACLCGRTQRWHYKYRGAVDCLVKEDLIQYIITNSSHYAPPHLIYPAAAPPLFSGPASLLQPTPNPLIRLLALLFIYLRAQLIDEEVQNQHWDPLESINITHSCVFDTQTRPDPTWPLHCRTLYGHVCRSSRLIRAVAASLHFTGPPSSTEKRTPVWDDVKVDVSYKMCSL